MKIGGDGPRIPRTTETQRTSARQGVGPGAPQGRPGGVSGPDTFTRARPFPRQSWSDTRALMSEIRQTRSAMTRFLRNLHPRLRLLRRHLGGLRPGPAATDRPVVMARYGLAVTQSRPLTRPQEPVVMARYGLATTQTGGNRPRPQEPVIMARYGLAVTQGRPLTRPQEPVIMARYGLAVTQDGPRPPSTDAPVLMARYGLAVRQD